MGWRLIEFELRGELGSGEVEGCGLVEVEFGLGRAACGRDQGRPMRQVEMREDALDGGGEVMKEMIRISPPQTGHRSGNTS
jgi:hypothetical protein